MKKIMILLSILLAGVLLFTGCVIKVNDDSSVFLEFSENDGLPTEINVAAGNSFAISLEANATTGYSWTAAIDDESIVYARKQRICCRRYGVGRLGRYGHTNIFGAEKRPDQHCPHIRTAMGRRKHGRGKNADGHR